MNEAAGRFEDRRSFSNFRQLFAQPLSLRAGSSSCVFFLSPAIFKMQSATVTCEILVPTDLHFSFTDEVSSNMTISNLHFLANHLASTCRTHFPTGC